MGVKTVALLQRESDNTETLRARHEIRGKIRVKNENQISTKNRPKTGIKFHVKAITARGPAMSNAPQDSKTLTE